MTGLPKESAVLLNSDKLLSDEITVWLANRTLRRDAMALVKCPSVLLHIPSGLVN
jgi:hypothetical protein